MPKIGGNIDAQVQIRATTKNNIGEAVKSWTTVQTLHGWLDYTGGDSKYTSFNAKIEETTHIFICDYVTLTATIKNTNSRLQVGSEVYDILLIDNPMELNKQLEGELNERITNSRKSATPDISVSANMSITFNGVTYSLVAGTVYHDVGITLHSGTNQFSATGTGTITFTWQEGGL